MTKGFKILLAGGIFLVIIIIVYFVVKPPITAPQVQPAASNQNNGNNKLPEYILSSDEETRVKEFAFNFIKLYNTYSYSDYSNMLALGDYETPEMQQKTLDLVDKLKVTEQVGFMQEAEADLNYFSYEYPESSSLFVKVKIKKKQYSNYYPKPELDFKKLYIPKLEQTKTESFKLHLSKYGKNWLVNNIESINY
jgi:hypothetical protein